MFNRIILIGRLTTDPELRTTPQGINVSSFSIAVNRPSSSKGGERQTDFINIVAWRNNAEFITKYFSKGRLIGIEGSLQSRSYTDKEGNKRTNFEVLCDRAFFTESKGSATGASSDGQPSYTAPAAVPFHSEPTGGVSYATGSAEDFVTVTDDDDLPF